MGVSTLKHGRSKALQRWVKSSTSANCQAGLPERQGRSGGTPGWKTLEQLTFKHQMTNEGFNGNYSLFSIAKLVEKNITSNNSLH